MKKKATIVPLRCYSCWLLLLLVVIIIIIIQNYYSTTWENIYIYYIYILNSYLLIDFFLSLFILIRHIRKIASLLKFYSNNKSVLYFSQLRYIHKKSRLYLSRFIQLIIFYFTIKYIYIYMYINRGFFFFLSFSFKGNILRYTLAYILLIQFIQLYIYIIFFL